MANKHNRGVPRTGDNIHIPLSEEEALRLAFQVKPTKDMPRPGTNASSAKKQTRLKKQQDRDMAK
jgi:hypothetical protein